MPRRARAGGSLRSATRLRAPRGSPAASARAAEATRESMSGRITAARRLSRTDNSEFEELLKVPQTRSVKHQPKQLGGPNGIRTRVWSRLRFRQQSLIVL